MGSVHITVGAKSSSKAIITIGRICSYIFLILIALISLCPLILLIISATRSDVGFSLIPSGEFGNNFSAAFTEDFLLSFLNSFLVAAASGVLSSYFSALTAYGIHVYNFRFKKLTYGFILLMMLFPPQIYAAGFVNWAFKLGLDNTFWPLIIPSIAAPVVFFYMKRHMDTSLPIEVIEAARIDGAGEFRIFNTIALPAIRPAIAVQMLLSFIVSWNSYFIPSLILSDKNARTLPVWLAMLRDSVVEEQAWGRLYMTILLAIAPIILIYIFASKHIIRGISAGEGKE